MKYILACQIIIAVSILLIVVFGLGGLYFGVVYLLERMKQSMRKYSTDNSGQEVGA